jgi:Ca2+-binding RTX toxin-like protein
MNFASSIFAQSELSLAAYANLIPGIDPIFALKDNGKGMSDKQAKNFADTYNVVTQYNDSLTEGGLDSGLSVTVFQNKDTKQLTVAIRGTEIEDYRDVITDAVMIDKGVAYNQVVALYNWWKRETTPSNEQVTQYRVMVSIASPSTQAINLGDNFWLEMAGTVNATGGLIPALALDPDHKVEVTGHSLGGHLAMAFSALFASFTTQATVFNAPGFKDTATNQTFFAALGGTVPTGGPIINVIADEANIGNNPLNVAAGINSRPGTAVGIAIENQWQSDETATPAALNHSQQTLTDALAVYAMLGKLDPTLTTASFKHILNAEVIGTAGSLEGIVDAIEKVLGIDNNRMPTGNANRDLLFQALDRMQNGTGKAAFEAAIGSGATLRDLSIFGADQIASIAKNNIAYRYALKAGNPFALLGADYGLHNQNGELNLYDKTTGQGELTDEWIADRSKFLTWMIKANTDDKTAISDGGSEQWAVEDKTLRGASEFLPYSLDINSGLFGTSGNARKMIFGKDTDDIGLFGGDKDDRIYGGGCNDTLDGGKGDDYLEGNSGNDTLKGGEDRDTLLGGTGDDTLEGGKGNDLLIGGVGDDTYKFTSGDGWDWIDDQGGIGHIEYDGATLGTQTITKNAAANVWQEGTGSATVTYSLYDRTENNETYKVLSIQGKDGGMWVKRWSDGQLGITLPGALPPETLPLGAIDVVYRLPSLLGTPISAEGVIKTPQIDARGLGRMELTAVGEFGEVWGSGKISGNDSANFLRTWTNSDSELYGQGGKDVLWSGDGNDKLYGGDADDALSAGNGNDFLDGGIGSDFLSGGAGGDILEGGDGDDYLFGCDNILAVDFNWSVSRDATNLLSAFYGFSGITYPADDGADILRGGAGSDYLWGGLGGDQLDGGADNDFLYGDAGDDYLSGGLGDDQLRGDESQIRDSQTFTTPQDHGNDMLDGGDGNDTLYGDGGADDLYGGDGNDLLVGDSADVPIAYQGADYLDGGAGNDTLYGYGKDDRLFGGTGDDVLEGDSSDVAFADHGNDYLDGGDGNDVLKGDGGSDTLLGGAGNDRLFGDSDDTPVAYQGDDFLDGQEGDDYLRGQGGNDQLIGGAGNDELLGEAGSDALDGGAGDDKLDGGDGNDFLTGGSGTDGLWGGAGDDTYTFHSGDGQATAAGVLEAVYEESGNDTVRFEGVSNIKVSAVNSGAVLLVEYGASDKLVIVDGVGGAIENFEVAGEKLTSSQFIGRYAESAMTAVNANGFEVISGGQAGDVLVAAGANATLSGGRGNDTIIAAGDNATLLYNLGDGTDWVTTGGIGNVLRLGPGISAADLKLSLGSLALQVGSDANDTIHFDSFDAQNPLAQKPFDRIEFADGSSITYENLLARGFDLTGSGGDDTINGSGVMDRINGGAGNDILLGMAGDDVLDGGAGNDILNGGTGSDTYRWGIGSGQDTINNADTGLAKADVLAIGVGLAPANLAFVRSGNDLIVRVRDTTDQVIISNHYAGGAIDSVRFDDGTVWNLSVIDAHITNELTSGSDIYSGSEGNDSINGLDGNDTLNGLGGDDLLVGGNGADSLSGGSGSDTLDGRGDATGDLMRGGLDSDVYLFARGSGADIIVEGGDATSVDVLRFDAGIAPTDIQVSRSSDDLIFQIANTTDQIKVVGAYAPSADASVRIERIEFADGTVWGETEIRQKILLGAATSANDVINGFDGNDTVRGLAGNDTLYGNAGSDLIEGGDGQDSLYGGDGDDRLDGGIGVVNSLRQNPDSDLLCGGLGSDTYYFGRDSGNDVISENGSNATDVDTVILSPDVTPDDILVTRVNDGSGYDHLLLSIRRTDGWAPSDTLKIQNFFVTRNNTYRVEQVKFANGIIWTAADMEAMTLTGTDFGNALYGNGLDETLDGKGGNDTLSSFGGNDILIGGAGNDTLRGGTGDDIYRFGRGDGSDLIDEVNSGGGVDTLELGAGISAANVTLYRVADDLVVVLDGSPTQTKVSGFFASASAQIERIKFADLTEWTVADITARVIAGTPNAMVGTVGNDTFVVDDVHDTITEAANQGTDTVQSSVDWKLGVNLENLTLTGVLNINGNGNSVRNIITGNSGNNILDGGGGMFSTLLDGRDTFRGGAGDDTYYINLIEGDAVEEQANEGNDTIYASANANYVIPINVENMYLYNRGTVNLTLSGNDADNVIWEQGSDGSLVYIDSYGNLIGDVINGGLGADDMTLSKGGTFYVDNIGDRVHSGGSFWVYSSVDFALPEYSMNYPVTENLTLQPYAGNINGTGNNGNNMIVGSYGDNVLIGGGGNDTLISNGGNDTLIGGLGNDNYNVSYWSGNVVIQNAADDGSAATDTLTINGGPVLLLRQADDLMIYRDSYSSITIKSHFAENGVGGVDKIVFAGTGAVWDSVLISQNLTVLSEGTSGADLLRGTFIGDSLSGREGDDQIWGGDGADRLYGDAGFDSLYGENDNDFLDGGDGNDQLSGGAGDDTLNGGAGNDLIDGGIGNDLYLFKRGDGSDVISDYDQTLGNVDVLRFDGSISRTDIQVTRDWDNLFLSVNGTSDRIQLASWWTSDSSKIERVEFSDGVAWSSADLLSNLMTQSSTAGDDLLFGLDGNDIIHGLEGNDDLVGSKGDDLLFGDSGNDIYEFHLGDGHDQIENIASDSATAIDSLRFGVNITSTSVSLSKLGDDLIVKVTATDSVTIRNHFLVGDAHKLDEIWFSDGTHWDQAAIELHLGAGDDLLTGTALSDTLHGLAGNDTIFGGDGNDFLYGDDGNDSLNGEAGNDLLDGGLGADVMKGGIGNDIYVVENAADVVTENLNEGLDTVQSSITLTLSANVENLILTGSATINGTGNALDNVLTGNAAANVLSGGAGNDVYFVGAGDTVTESASQGTDTVNSDVTFTLGANLENLTLTGSALINGTGNTLNNVLTGNSAANTLNGGTGNDTMAGGSGDDIYVVDSISDIVTENANEGADLVQSSVTYTLSANVENLTLTGTTAINGTGNALDNVLTGNSAINTLTGGAGNDTLDGGAGNDTMVGGQGDDTYIVDSASDVVTENASEGSDTVRSSVTVTLANNVENIVLTGATAINATGNTLNNVLTGNSAANTLSGGTGADTMIGGAGNDTYVVDNVGDVVTENLNEGTDLVQSSVTYTLSANVENLTLTGTTAINGVGNELDNVLTGNSAANTLTGGAGNDTLSGGTGADTMMGGIGNDTYVVDNTADIVTEALNEGTDLVQSSVTYTLSANVENLTLTGTTAINGTGNALDNILTGNSANNTLTGGDGNDTIDGGTGNDTMVGGLGDDVYVVNVSTDIVTEAANAGNDTIQSAVTLTLATNVENLVLTGTTAINGTGNTLNNLVRGNTGINTLNGGTGNDILEGGDGNDILTDTSGTALFNGGIGDDSITGGAGAEIFLGGLGNDTYTTAGGNDILLFNKGDGQDTFATGGTGSDVISLGGGITYADLVFTKATNDLVLKIGATDQITFKNWYATTPSKPVANLQVMAEAMAGFVQGASNPLLDQKVENFNFAGLVGAFDTARAANTGLTSWALTNALSSFQLAGSDTAALGGDLAYQYGKNGTLAGVGVTPALATLSDANLGTSAQALTPLSGLQTGSVRLS